jgi:hypothetical protein
VALIRYRYGVKNTVWRTRVTGFRPAGEFAREHGAAVAVSLSEELMDRWALLVRLAGLGQIGLAAVSLAIPRILRWREGLAGLRPIHRQLFWTYAAYVFGTNVAMGALSALAPRLLTGGTPLARAVALFIAAYWGVRLGIQLLWLDRTDLPRAAWARAAEVILVVLFASWTTIYAAAAAIGAPAP